eukprot:scaffold2.g7089.t1
MTWGPEPDFAVGLSDSDAEDWSASAGGSDVRLQRPARACVADSGSDSEGEEVASSSPQALPTAAAVGGRGQGTMTRSGLRPRNQTVSALFSGGKPAAAPPADTAASPAPAVARRGGRGRRSAEAAAAELDPPAAEACVKRGRGAAADGGAAAVKRSGAAAGCQHGTRSRSATPVVGSKRRAAGEDSASRAKRRRSKHPASAGRQGQGAGHGSARKRSGSRLRGAEAPGAVQQQRGEEQEAKAQEEQQQAAQPRQEEQQQQAEWEEAPPPPPLQPAPSISAQPASTAGGRAVSAMHASILNSPSPSNRSRRTASTAVGGGGGGGAGVQRLTLLPAFQLQLQAGAAQGAAANQGEEVDQPPPPQQQQQQPPPSQQQQVLAAAGAAGPSAAGLAGPAQQPAAAAGAAKVAEAPAPTPATKRQRVGAAGGAAAGAAGASPLRRSPRVQQRERSAAAAAGGASSVRFADLPAGTTKTPGRRLSGSPGDSTARKPAPRSEAATPVSRPPADAGAAEAEGDDAWWDPTDAAKVRQAKAAFHVSASGAAGALPLCRERQAAALAAFLGAGLAQRQGGSIYLSGLPGTGKSLTAHQVVRQCWRGPPAAGDASAAAAAAAAAPVEPPPALISINCMSLTDPQQAVERILQGYEQSCATPHPAAAAAAGQDLLARPASAGEGGAPGAAARRRAGSGGASPLEQLTRLVMAPLPVAAAPEAAARKGRGRKRSAPAGKRGRVGGDGGAGAAGDGVSRGMLVVILDELDSLLSGRRGEELVEGLFCLAHGRGSRLLLIGIANSIDLVQQLLKPGGALHRRNLRPQHELFPSYMRHQFAAVLAQRQAGLPGRALDPAALEFCARKMANGTGDMRRALEACSQAIDAAAKEAAAAQQQQQQQEAGAAAAPPAWAAAGMPAAPAGAQQQQQKNKKRLVGLRQMLAALTKVTGGVGLTNDNVRAIAALPPQQQLLMAAVGKLLGDTLGGRGTPLRLPATPSSTARKAAAAKASAAAVKHTVLRGARFVLSPAASLGSRRSGASAASGGGALARSREVLVGQLEEAFSALCKTVGMAPYTPSEFATACSVLEDLGLIGLAPARDPRARRVSLRVPEDDILLALADKPVLRVVVGAE